MSSVVPIAVMTFRNGRKEQRNMNTDYMSAVNAEDKERAMITKEFLENHFKFHNKLTIYQGQIPLTITKAWHLHLNCRQVAIK